MVILSGLLPSAGFVRRSHVGEIIGTPELEGPYMLGNPLLANAIDEAFTHHAPTASPFPDGKSPMRGELATNGGAHIRGHNKGHVRPPSDIRRTRGGVLRLTLPALSPERFQNLPEQALLFRMQNVPGRQQIGELALPSSKGRNKAHLQAE
jgi:hypothetical protein